jgi:hypothetical protein
MTVRNSLADMAAYAYVVRQEEVGVSHSAATTRLLPLAAGLRPSTGARNCPV